MPQIQRVNPAAIAPPGGRYSQVVTYGEMVFVAGQTAVDVGGNVVGVGDPDAQARQVYANVLAAVQAAGGTALSIVRQRVYLLEPGYLSSVRLAREAVFGTEAAPASTVLVVKALARPEFLIEVDADAIVPEHTARRPATGRAVARPAPARPATRRPAARRAAPRTASRRPDRRGPTRRSR